jgi:hypothetical protein
MYYNLQEHPMIYLIKTIGWKTYSSRYPFWQLRLLGWLVCDRYRCYGVLEWADLDSYGLLWHDLNHLIWQLVAMSAHTIPFFQMDLIETWAHKVAFDYLNMLRIGAFIYSSRCLIFYPFLSVCSLIAIYQISHSNSGRETSFAPISDQTSMTCSEWAAESSKTVF